MAPSILSKFTNKSKKQAVSDDEKAFAYEKEATRYDGTSRGGRPGSALGSDDSKRRLRHGNNTPTRDRYIGSFAPNPAFTRLVRFLLFGLTSLSAIVTAALGCAVVNYYNQLAQAIEPAWGSLIACIVFGFGTPVVLFGLFLVTPRLFRPGSFLYIINQTKIELLVLFAAAAVWVSGAIALACDLRGREYCLWDGYYHYPKPANFDHVCKLINIMVALAYTTFGLTALQLVVVFMIATYIFLYLDQEVLTEPANDMGGRAYRARLAALEHRRTAIDSQKGYSTAGPRTDAGMSEVGGPMAGGIPTSRRVPGSSTGPADYDDHEAGPMAGGRMRPLGGDDDEEHMRPDSPVGGSSSRLRYDDTDLGDEDARELPEDSYYGFQGSRHV